MPGPETETKTGLIRLMERPRVLYLAKTKTAKVIKPTLPTHPLSSESSMATEVGSHLAAPLASIEPDILGVPKSNHETHKTPTLRGQGYRPATVTNICSDQAFAADSAAVIDDKSYNKLNGSTPPRAYTRPRSATDSNLQEKNPNARRNHRLYTPRSGKPFLRGPSTNEPKHYIDNKYGLESDSHSLLTHFSGKQHVSLEKINHHVSNHSYSRGKLDKEIDRNSHHETGTVVKRHSYPSAEQKNHHSIERPPPVAPKPKRDHTKSSVPFVPKPDSAHSDSSTRNSKPGAPAAAAVKQNGYVSSKENRIETSSNFYANKCTNDSRMFCDSVHKPGLDSSKSPGENVLVFPRTQSKQESMTLETSRVEDNYLSFVPEINSPVKFWTEDSDPLPEMYSISEPLSPTRIPPRSTPGVCALPSHMSRSTNNRRKPLASIDICFNKLDENSTIVMYNDQKTLIAPCTDQTASDIQLSTNSTQLKQDIIHNTKHVNRDSSNIYHSGAVSAENCDLFLIPECKSRWKRNSMRLATQGYTSMSDLTNSLECLTWHNHADTTTARLAGAKNDMHKQNEERDFVCPGNVCPAESEVCETVVLTNQREQSCKDVFANDDAENEPKPDCGTLKLDDSHKQPVMKVNRNGITRLSYKMATSNRTNMWIHGDDMCDHVDDSNQTTVRETNNENTDFDTAHIIEGSHAGKSSRSDDVIRNEQQMPNSANPQRSLFDRQDEEAQSTKIKRLSFLLAMCNVTGLTFPDIEFEMAKSPSDNEKCDATGDSVNTTMESAYSSSYHTPQSQHGQSEEGSSSGSGRRSSFGSVYSSRGLDIGRSKPSQEKAELEAKYQPCFNKHWNDSTLTCKANVTSDSVEMDSFSCDSSCYCTASSDASFITSDSDLQNGPQLNESTQKSPKLQTHNRWSPRRSSQDDRSRRLSSQDDRSSRLSSQDDRSSKLSSQDDRSRRLSSQDDRSSKLSSQDDRSSKLSSQDDRSSKLSSQDDGSGRRSSQDDRSSRLSSQDDGSSRLSPQDDRTRRLSSQDQRSPTSTSQGQRSPRLSTSHDQRSFRLPSQESRIRQISSQDQRSPDLLPRDQRQWSPKNNRQTNRTHNSSTNNKHPQSHNVETGKHSNPINNVLQCYGCGLNDRHSSQAQIHGSRNSSRRIPNMNRPRTKYETSQDWCLEDFKRHNSKRHTRHPDRSPRYVSNPIRTFTESDNLVRDQTSTRSIPTTPSSSSPTCSIEHFRWGVTPNFPPSLGRPRRKLYAGFDSQPLPMDSFLSDSSSVYSVQSCGSWGTSKSAEVESVSRTPETSPKVRAVSSIASSTYASARDMSQDEVFDFISFTEKSFSASQNNQNLYLNRENSFVDDCFEKNNCYNMTFSKESLESQLSDSTTVGVEHQENADHNQDLNHAKSYLDVVPDSAGRNNSAATAESIKRTNETRRKLDRMNNSFGLEYGSRNNDTNSYKGGEHYNKNQENPLKASSSVTSARPRFVSSGDYSSSKDIIDHFMTSDKKAQNGLKSLERQAQKMTKLLCVTTKSAMHQQKNTTC